MIKKGYTLIEVLISFLIIGAIGMATIYTANGYLKNAHMQDLQRQELVQNMNTIEQMKATVKTKTELEEFANNHTSNHTIVTLTTIEENLYKITVGSERKLIIVVRVKV